MSGWAIFLIVIIVLLVLGAGGYIGYAHYRARKLGLSPPQLNPFSRNNQPQPTAAPYRAPAPAPGGITGWVQDKWSSLRNTRTAGGAYETSGRSRRGFGPLDPDEAWDSRVENEYYEPENELQEGPYGGGGYGERGRQRELDERYEEEALGQNRNPFGDHAAAESFSGSRLRSVSPRPDTAGHGQAPAGHKKGVSSLDDSPNERRSMFHEDV